MSYINKFQIKQSHINHIKTLYREWAQLVPRLAAVQDDWQRGIGIMRELADFYFDGDYARLQQAMGNDLSLDLHTAGEDSVMSEDAIWNVLQEQQTLAWQRLRSALAVLDRDGENGRSTSLPHQNSP